MILIQKRHFITIFILFLGSNLLTAQTRGSKFERISGASGLSVSTVRSILQDQTGFLWFGTDDGLNRYDGYSFKIYKRQAHDSNSLSHNMIWCLLEDHFEFQHQIMFLLHQMLVHYHFGLHILLQQIHPQAYNLPDLLQVISFYLLEIQIC